MTIALLASPLAAQSPQALITVDRTAAEARLVDFTAEGRIAFAVAPTDGGAVQPLAIAADDLVVWGAPAEFERLRTYVTTVDGGVFVADTLAVTGEQLDFISPVFDSRTLPLALVRGAVFQAPSARAARDRLFRRLTLPGEGDRDRLLLAGGDEVQGTLTSLDSRHASLETDVGPAKIDLGRAAAVVFNPALAMNVELPPRRILVGLQNGTLVTASSLVGRERVTLMPVVAPPNNKTEAGTPQPWEVDREEIVYLQTLGGRATYLSDLAPTGYKHVPYLELVREYHLDGSVGAGDLRVGGRRYPKGIGMHSTSRLSFPLDLRFTRFAAEIAIDDETGGRGSVVFRVFVDAAERYRSDVVRGGDPPTPIVVDVAGGKQLSLVVDFAEEADVLDHADWLNARLVP